MPRSRQNAHSGRSRSWCLLIRAQRGFEYHASHLVGRPRTPIGSNYHPAAEGPNTPRHAVPKAATRLRVFGQVVAAAVVRSAGPADDTRAYVVMPSFETLEECARWIETEIPANDGEVDKSRPGGAARSALRCTPPFGCRARRPETQPLFYYANIMAAERTMLACVADRRTDGRQ